jgi:hypothetical protein
LCCRACLRLLDNRKDFDQHAQYHLNTEGRRSCRICNTKFAADKDLVKHFKTSHPRQRTFHCPYCAWGNMLKFAKLKYHTEKLKGSCSTLTIFNPLYSCDICGHTWSTKNFKEAHRRLHCKGSLAPFSNAGCDAATALEASKLALGE